MHTEIGIFERFENWLMSLNGKEVEPDWDEKCFKKVREGWIFWLPNLWIPWMLCGPGHYYFLNDKQKADVVAYVRRIGETRPWKGDVIVMVTTIVTTSTVLSAASVDHPLKTIIIGLIAFFTFGLWSSIDYWRKLRPILTGLPRTTQRMTLAERYRMAAMTLSRAYWILVTVISIPYFALGVYGVATSQSALQFFISLAYSAILGSVMIFFIVMLAIKFKAANAPPSS